MSAFSFARQAFRFEKPHSSVTDWIEILTSNNIQEEAYDGIPELVDAISLQASGPAEAARALRKKLKHGQPHQQYRSLVLIKALVENAGPKFHGKPPTFSDGQLIEVFKQLNVEHSTDKRVRKKLTLILSSWRDQYSSDPSMSLFAGLHNQCRGDGRRHTEQELAHLAGLNLPEYKREREKEEAKMRAKREKKEQERRRLSGRTPFNLDKDKPKVLSNIAEASQASSNLVNAMMLVNLETDSLLTNQRVQECLFKAKQTKKTIVRYIQMVENEELIGTLIEANDRIISALQMYEDLTGLETENAHDDATAVTRAMAATHIDTTQNEVRNGETATERGKKNNVHPDLQDLSFGPLGNSSNHLPAPLKPSRITDGDEDPVDAGRGSLSDFSDYDSSDEETHNARPGPSKRQYIDVSDDAEDDGSVHYANKEARAPLVSAIDDPFADPFADHSSTPKH
ncbi:hypothetical protein AMATHDRAFT_134726 [Amanita thiersii Skay4041]|uniref:VHS domain-containing protein n=1 Tax=Amanita thiersii Skay4041 TaxID=703135 RepID=A0A2A9P1X7_9AGAR|nr:hypothetical protein AMATHDRAFT_134726 [Amanita thiersii Skay4041]